MCSICFNVLQIPRKITGCNHTYCRGCIDEWLQSADSFPVCRERGTTTDLSSDILTKISTLSTKCRFIERGCDQRIPFVKILTQKAGCRFQFIPCPYHCGAVLPTTHMPQHVQFCAFGVDLILDSLLCFFCQAIYRAGRSPDHSQVSYGAYHKLHY